MDHIAHTDFAELVILNEQKRILDAGKAALAEDEASWLEAWTALTARLRETYGGRRINVGTGELLPAAEDTEAA